MRKFKQVIKGGLGLGLAVSLMLSGSACGKEEAVVEDYGGETESITETEDVSESSETETESDNSVGGSLTEMYGETISETDTFTIGGVNGAFKLNYKVPEAATVNVYDGEFIENNSDIEAQIVNNFFGGTEAKLEEIKYENESDYIQLLYKYRKILMFHDLGGLDAVATQEDFNKYFRNINSSFDEVYTWIDEDDYYIHMYEGEYNGNRYGMIYSYDMSDSTRSIYISPISITDYLPEIDAKTMYVVDQQSDYGSDNPCSMSEDSIRNDAHDVLSKLGFDNKDIELSFNPNMAIMDEGTFDYSEMGLSYTEMPKLIFADSDVASAFQKINALNPTGFTYAYRFLKEQEEVRPGQISEDVQFAENGYAVYLCTAPFSENVVPQPESTFNRGSIFYTDKGLFTVDISQTVHIDNVVDDVQLLSFNNIKEFYKEALQNDSDIVNKSSGSIDVIDVDFTYVLIEDKDNGKKATYVPAWVFTTQDNKLKSGETALLYTHVINAIDGTDLKDTIR